MFQRVQDEKHNESDRTALFVQALPDARDVMLSKETGGCYFRYADSFQSLLILWNNEVSVVNIRSSI